MHDLDRTLRELENGPGRFDEEGYGLDGRELELEDGDHEFEGGDYELEGGDYELEGGDYEFEGGDYEFEGGDYEFEGGDYEFEGGDYELGLGNPELEGPDEELESGFDGEQESDFGPELEGDAEAVFDEVEEMELAGTLLEITDEQELDYFIKGILKKASQVGARLLGMPEGKALTAVLRKVARKALPAAGAALGNLFVPGAGGAAGAQLGSAASRIFGLELEGMSPQDQEFEVARRFVRLAAAAAQEVTASPPRHAPSVAANDAVLQAARRYAPGLAGRRSWRSWPGPTYGARRWNYGSQGPMGGVGGWTRSGQWIRRGRRIILYNV